MNNTLNTHCKLPSHGRHQWKTLVGLEILACEILCAICGKECQTASALRKHIKTHLLDNEWVAPAKKRGGPMSNLEKRQLDEKFKTGQGPAYDPERIEREEGGKHEEEQEEVQEAFE